jgi:hypothetical protein
MCLRILLIVVVFGFGGCYSSRSGDQIATFQRENEAFTIRVTVLTEKRYFAQVLAGAFYVFEAKKNDEQHWREIFVFLHDDPIPIDEEGIRFVNDRVAYVYMSWMYAVTTDGGETWSVWDGSKYPLERGRIGFNAIQNVKLLENGEGTMRLKLVANNDPIFLRTKDFGINWIDEGD